MDAETELHHIENEIELRLGRGWRDHFRSAADALDAIFHHSEAVGAINRNSLHWFSNEDYQAIRHAAETDPLFGALYAAVARCHSGAEVMRVVTQALLEMSRVNAHYQKIALDAMKRSPAPMMFPLPQTKD